MPVSAHDELRLQNFIIEKVIIRGVFAIFYFIPFFICLGGKYRYRGPAGRLDTLHVLSERGWGGGSIEKSIEGPSSYSYT